MIAVDAEEPSHAGVFELEEAGSAVCFAQMHDVFFGRPEDPGEHIEEVHPDIGGHASCLLHIAFPRLKVPFSAAGDVGKVHVVHLSGRSGFNLPFQVLYSRVEAQLQDGIDLFARFLFNFLQGIQVPGVEHQRLFADGVAAVAQRHTDMGIVQVVGAADAYIIDAALPVPAQLVEVAVEALGFRKKFCIRKIAVHNADSIVRIERTHQVVPGFLDGFHVAWGNVACGTD